MKFSYVIDPERRLISQYFEGELTLAGLTESLRRLWADPAYCSSYNGFIDISKVSAQATFDDLRAFIEFVQGRPEHSRGRWVAVTSSPFLTACAMLYRNALANHHVFAVFSSYEAACAFLHITEPAPVSEMRSVDVP